MASRQEEKEQRRQERMAQEQAEKAAAARARRARAVIFGLLAVGLVALIAVAGLGALTGDDDGGEAGGGRPPSDAANVTLPDPQTTSLEEAVKAAGCKLEHPKYEGAGHEERDFKASDYKTNPPTSGTHFPEWYEDGIYAPGDADNLGMTVHALEHGRINVQYKPGTDEQTVRQLEAFLAEKTGYHLLLFENQTDMPYQVAATAWTHLLGCPTMKPEVFDALRTFYQEYVDKGPERVP